MSEATIPTAPVDLVNALSKLAVARAEEATFDREIGRDDVEYCDLGLAAASGGRIGAKINRVLRPFEHETGWHWHDLTLHVVYVLKGSLTFRFRGEDAPVTVRAGDFINQPPGVAHNVVGRSDDLEVLEITMPAVYGTHDLPAG